MDDVSLNALDDNGRTCLHNAAQGMHVTSVALLVKSGAAASQCVVVDNSGHLPVHLFLRTAATSLWRRRLSSSQLVEVVLALMRSPPSDMWRYYPLSTDFRVHVNDPSDARVDSASIPHTVAKPSILLQLMALGDYAIATAVIPIAVGAVKHWKAAAKRNAEALTVPNAKDQSTDHSSSTYFEDPGPPMTEIKLQVQVMIAEAVRRKRVRVLLLLISSFIDVFDIFGLGCSADKEPPEERYNFFLRCLELAVLGGCLRTTIALMDAAPSVFNTIFESAQNHTLRCLPSCFLHFAIARGDTLMLKLCLERLKHTMDLWVCFPGLSASQCAARNSLADKASTRSNEMFLRSMLQINLDLGFFDEKFVATQLHLLSPIAMACLVDDLVALELIFSRLSETFVTVQQKRPFFFDGSVEGRYTSRSKSFPDYSNIDFIGCSPLVCCVLSCSSKCLRALKVHLGDEDFMTRSVMSDSLGLVPLPTLCHILRIQNDHVGTGIARDLWTNLMQAAADVVRRCEVHNSQSRDESRSKADNVTAGLLSPSSKKLLLYSKTAFSGTTDVNDSPQYRSSAPNIVTSPTLSRLSSVKTPQKKLSDKGSNFDFASPSKSRESLVRTPSSSRSRTPRSAAKAKQSTVRDTKSFTLHKQETSFTMQGIRYDVGNVNELLNLLTDFSGIPEHSASWTAMSNALAEIQCGSSSVALRKRLVQVCQQLQRSAFPNHLATQTTLRFIDERSPRYFNITSGRVVPSSDERVILLVSGASVSAVDPKSGTISDAVPKGYLVEDLRASLMAKFPVLSAVVTHLRTKRERWLAAPTLGWNCSETIQEGYRSVIRGPSFNRRVSILIDSMRSARGVGGNTRYSIPIDRSWYLIVQMLNIIISPDDSYPSVTFNIDESLDSIARKLRKGSSVSSALIALSYNKYVTEAQYSALMQLLDGLRIERNDLTHLRSRVMQGLAKVGSWARPKLVPGLEAVSHVVTIIISDAVEYYELQKSCGAEAIEVHIARAAQIDEMDSLLLRLHSVDQLERKMPSAPSAINTFFQEGNCDRSSVCHAILSCWIHHALMCLVNAHHETVPYALGALVHSYGSMLREFFDVGVIPASNKCLLRCNGSYMAGVGSSRALGASLVREPRIKALCDLDNFTENRPSDLFSTAVKKLSHLLANASSANGYDSMLLKGLTVGSPSPVLCMAARDMWPLIMDLVSDTPKARSIATGREHIDSVCIIDSSIDAYITKIRGDYSSHSNPVNDGAVVPRERLADHFSPVVATSEGVMPYASIDFFDVAVRRNAGVEVLVTYMQATRQFGMKKLSDIMRKALSLDRPAICGDIAIACAVQELRCGQVATLSRAPAMRNTVTSSASPTGRYPSKQLIARASTLIECIGSAARRSRDDVTSKFLARGGHLDYLPVVNSVDGAMLRRTADSIVAHYDGPLAGLCTDAQTGDVVLRDNARVPLDVFKSNMSLLAWALVPPLKATGELNTGYTFLHALLESGFVDIVQQALLHERLLQSIGAADPISVTSALASVFYSLDSNGNSAATLALASNATDLVSVKDLLSLVDAPLDEAEDNPAISQASSSSSAVEVATVPAKIGPATFSKLHTITIRPGKIDARSLFAQSMQRALESAETAFNLTCVDTIEAASHIDHADVHSLDSVKPEEELRAAHAMRGFGNVSSLVLLMRRLERQWSRLKRADLRPLMKSLYESGPEGCPYDSVHRAKAAMMMLNVAFSKIITSSDGSFNSASLGSTVALYHSSGPSSSAPKLRRGAVDRDISKENAKPGTVSTGLASDEEFDKLTVSKVMKMITLNSASELRVLLCDWLRLRGEKPPSLRSLSASELSKAFINEYSRRCSLEEHLVATRFTDISLVLIGNAGSTGGIRVAGRSMLRSKLGSKWDGEYMCRNDTPVVTPFPLKIDGSPSFGKSRDGASFSSPDWASDYVGRSWDRPYMERMRELPPHLMAELKGNFRGSGTRGATAHELVYSRLSTVMTEWKLRPDTVKTVLNLAYEVLDFARTASACRILLAATYEYPAHVGPRVLKSPSDYSSRNLSIETKDLAVDEDSLVPADRPQLPLVLQKAEAKGILRRSHAQEGTLDGLISPEGSDDEGETPGDLAARGVSMFNGAPGIESDRPLHPLERVRVELDTALIYKEYVNGMISKFASDASSGRFDTKLGVLSALYPDWSRYSMITKTEQRSLREGLDGSEIDRLRGDFRRRITSSKHEFWINIVPSQILDGACAHSEATIVFEAEFVGLYYFLSLELRISSKEFHSLRRDALKLLCLLTSVSKENRLCEFLCRRLRELPSEKYNTIPLETPLSSHPSHAANLMISSTEEAAFALLTFIHSFSMLDVLGLATTHLNSTSASSETQGLSSDLATWQRFIRSVHGFNKICKRRIENEKSLPTVSSRRLCGSSLCACSLHGVTPILQIFDSSESHSEPSIGTECDRFHGMKSFEKLREYDPLIATPAALFPTDSELADFTKCISPLSMNRNGSLGSNAMSAAAQAVINRALDRLRVAYCGIGAVGRFLNCVAAVARNKSFFRCDNMTWRVLCGFRNPLAVVAARVFMSIVASDVNSPPTETSSSYGKITMSLIHNGVSPLDCSGLELAYETQPDSDASKAVVSRTLLKEKFNNKSISPILLAAVAGRPEVLQALLQSTPDRAFLPEMPCHRHLVWHVLMQSPCALGNADHGLVVEDTHRGIAESPARRARVNGYEKCIEMLLDAGFRVYPPSLAATTCSLLGALKQFSFTLLSKLLLAEETTADKANPKKRISDHLLMSWVHVVAICKCYSDADMNSLFQLYVDRGALVEISDSKDRPLELADQLLTTGYFTIPDLCSDTALHCNAIARYGILHCTCKTKSKACDGSTEELVPCECEYSSFSSLPAVAAWTSQVALLQAEALVHLMPRASRAARCPIWRTVLSSARALVRMSQEVASEAGVPSPPSPSVSLIAGSRERESGAFYCNGLHFALASRDSGKFETCVRSASMARKRGEDHNYNGGNTELRGDEQLASSLIDWLPYSNANKEDDHKHANLMHFAAFYDCAEAIKLLTRSAIYYAYILLQPSWNDSYSPQILAEHLDPGASLKLFFDPLNRACTPLEVALELGTKDAATACIIRSEFRFPVQIQKAIFASRRTKVRDAVTWPMLRACVLRGKGGDDLALLLLQELNNHMAEDDLISLLCAPMNMDRYSTEVGAGCGESLLHVLVRRAWVDTLKYAITSLPQLSLGRLVDAEGCTLLRSSIASGHASVTRVLASHFPREVKAVRIIALGIRYFRMRSHGRRLKLMADEVR